MKHLLITICCLLATASAANAADIPGIPGLGGGNNAPFKQKNTYDASKDDPNVYYGAGGGVPAGSLPGATVPAAPSGGSTGGGH